MAEQHLHSILRHIPAGVATLHGAELRLSFLNEAMQAMLGPDAREGCLLADCGQQLPADLHEVIGQVYQSGQPFVAKAYGLVVQRPEDGEAKNALRYFDLALEPVREENDTVSGLLVFAVDVTGQEEARLEAHRLALETRRLDARLRVLTETVPQITFSLDSQGHYEYVSPQWYYFTGQPANAAVDAIWPLLIHPDDRLRILYQAEQARRTGTGWSYEYRLRRHDGQYRWMLSRALPELHAPTEPVFWHGALTEVHDQRELADALRRGEAELRFLADSIPELIWTATAEGFIDYYNRYTTDYSGLTIDDLGPTGWVSLLHPEEQAEAARGWVQSIASGKAFEGEYRMRRHDGLFRWHIIRARQLVDGRGLRWFGTCTDVQDQHLLHQALQTQYDELARAHHDLDTFVYAASHDLRQPALNLRGLFEELRSTATFHDPDEAALLGMVDGALGQLDATLHDLAATVRSQRAHQEPAEILDLALILEEVLLGLRPQAQLRQAQFEIDVAEVPGLLYSRANLRSVVHNLVSNALKFAHPDRQPSIRLRSYLTPEGQPALDVQDNGLGMDLSNPQAPIFQLFVRQHPDIEGTGVGLYLVQRIVTSQGGHVEVASTVGEGTTFTIYWTQPA
ncbi:MAG TPA: PAS domain-containing sensor histidine kinase [Hymenobacter sp.]|uniref:PAS domain-containing sensor histidine kinase n=1 Tax=Hymenobacter sp. TaxID=1898978 RepID=UPI002D7F2D68|nr:PAS domain-containing sensor histidine kinase [Hymenobacter sp.]HET9506218.1 PAS domain-containing sensor histidine kinase [Hymenobacter sp.]